MKYLVSLMFIFSFSLISFAQDGTIKGLKSDVEKGIQKDANDTIPQVWKKGGLFRLSINQSSLSNWSAGGEKFSFSLNAATNLYAFYKKDKKSWDNSLDLAYGIVNTTSLGNRKSSDRIDLTSKYGHAISKKVNLAALFNFRSQFANGYSYLKGSNGLDSATLTSKTLMPAYVLFSLGLDYKPNDNFSLFFSPVTARWVIVGNKAIAPLYGVEAGKSSRQEFGAYASANYFKKFKETLSFKSKLDLFSNYLSNPQNIDIYWTNIFAATITKYINFTFNFDLIYDDDTKNINPKKGPAPQIQQLMGIGFAYSFKSKKS